MPGPALTKAQAERVLEEKRRREVAKSGLLSACFPTQRAFIEDPARYKATYCTRRAGKSYGVGIYLFREAMANPGVNCCYLAKTRQVAKEMMLKDVFRDIDQRFQVGVKWNYADLTMTFPNGSVVYISGADANASQMHRVVGKKYRLIILDEAQYWSDNLWRLIYEGLMPTMTDWEGTICLCGVPSPHRGFFYEVTTKQRNRFTGELLYPEWSVHSWNALDNPHVRDRWREELAAIKKNNPKFMATPTYRQQWLGEWCDDPDARCYRYDQAKNWVAELPGNVQDYQWLLGLDLGYSPDPNGFVVCAYKKDFRDRCLYVVHAHKQGEMMIDEIAKYIGDLRKRWPIEQYVIDGSNRQVVEELRRRFQLPFDAAKKQGKVEFIHLVTDDLMSERIKLVGDGADGLSDEWMKLVWDRDNPLKPVPHTGGEDHLSDAFLYAWRYAFHYLKPNEDEKPAPDYGSQEWVIEREKRLAEQLNAKRDPVQVWDDFMRDPGSPRVDDVPDDLDGLDRYPS